MFRVSPPQLEALASQVSSTSTISDISQSRLVTLAAIAGVTRSVCDDERRRAEAATTRLRGLIAGGDARLIRVSCSCRHGQEGTKNCNYGRLCGSLLIGGMDVGGILRKHLILGWRCAVRQNSQPNTPAETSPEYSARPLGAP